MIELPEAVVIAGQIDQELGGKRIVSSLRDQWPHKWAFCTATAEEYAAILDGAAIEGARPLGSHVVVDLEGGQALVLGGGGERILFHRQAKTFPKKHQLLLRFDDDTYLTVSVQGWGSLQLVPRCELASHRHVAPKGASPLSAEFTIEYLQGLFAILESGEKRSIKYFCISEPGIWGLGNGYLQDILFQARLHPRRRAVDVTSEEQVALHVATVDILRQAVAAGGRTTERDLYNRRGSYARLMDSRTVGQPCPVCGAPIEKIQYLGGSCYLCPSCQH